MIVYIIIMIPWKRDPERLTQRFHNPGMTKMGEPRYTLGTSKNTLRNS